MRVEVGPKVHQPFGILHGGVSALLAEGAASIGGARQRRTGPDRRRDGTQLFAPSIDERGMLTATATPIRKGRTVQVWGDRAYATRTSALICVARCTLQVLPTPAAQ